MRRMHVGTRRHLKEKEIVMAKEFKGLVLTGKMTGRLFTGFNPVCAMPTTDALDEEGLNFETETLVFQPHSMPGNSDFGLWIPERWKEDPNKNLRIITALLDIIEQDSILALAFERH